MSEMVERVARAIYEKHLTSPLDTTELSWREIIASAAIAAMREPTPEMVEAARKLWTSNEAAIWQAMIDAALKEG